MRISRRRPALHQPRLEGKRLGSIFFLLVFAFAPESHSAESDPASLRAYVEKDLRRQAYGVYLNKHKFGWAVDELKLGRHAGQDVAIASFEIQGSFTSGGEKARFEEKSTTYFALEGKGEIVSGDERTVEDGNETTRSAVREGDGIVVTTRSRGGETKRRVPVPRETLQQMREFEAWLATHPKKGAKFVSYSTAWNEDRIDTKETFTYGGKKSILWGGVKTWVFLADVNIEGMNAAFEVLSDGTPLKGMMGGLFELRAEKEAVAKMPGAEPIDMLEASSIKVDKDLGDPRNISSLTLKISGADKFPVPSYYRQRIRSRTGKTILLELSPDRRIDPSTPLAPAERDQFLKPTPTIQCDHQTFRALAGQIVRDEKDVLQKAARLEKWVFSNVRQTMAANTSSALDVLANRAGDCTEITLLFVALARAANIPAREVGGVMYANEGDPLFGWHAWAEIHDGHQWVSVDPTWNQVYVDATHIKLSENSDDWAWVNLLGRMKIKVVKLVTKK